jgi:hypothetical protein
VVPFPWWQRGLWQLAHIALELCSDERSVCLPWWHQGLRNKRSSIVANGRRSSNSSSVGSERSRSASGFNGE